MLVIRLRGNFRIMARGLLTMCFLLSGMVAASFFLISVGLAGCSYSFEDLPSQEAFSRSSISVSDAAYSDKLVRKGDYLVNAIASCGTCHAAIKTDGMVSGQGASLSGGALIKDQFGDVVAANITPDTKTGIGNWSISELMRAIRSSIGKDGSALSLDSHREYRWMSDEDAKSIALYLLAQKPVSSPHERRTLGLFQRNRLGVIPRYSEVEGYVPALAATETAGYGRYLARNVAQCSVCHGGGSLESQTKGLNFGGGEIPKWETEGYITFLSGLGKEAKMATQRGCPVPVFRNMRPEDKKAVALYLTKIQ